MRRALLIGLAALGLPISSQICRSDLDYHAPTATRHPTLTVNYGAGSPTTTP